MARRKKVKPRKEEDISTEEEYEFSELETELQTVTDHSSTTFAVFRYPFLVPHD
jgi:hypothetical protein